MIFVIGALARGAGARCDGFEGIEVGRAARATDGRGDARLVSLYRRQAMRSSLPIHALYLEPWCPIAVFVANTAATVPTLLTFTDAFKCLVRMATLGWPSDSSCIVAKLVGYNL